MSVQGAVVNDDGRAKMVSGTFTDQWFAHRVAIGSDLAEDLTAELRALAERRLAQITQTLGLSPTFFGDRQASFALTQRTSGPILPGVATAVHADLPSD